MRLKHRLIPCGSGGCTSNGVKMLALHFDYRLPTEIEDGRRLLVSAVQEFVTAVNNEPKIHPHLKKYPFSAENVDICIFLQNPDGSKLSSGLRVISANVGELKYNIRNAEEKLETIHQETYEKALQKLSEQENSKNSEPVFEEVI